MFAKLQTVLPMNKRKTGTEYEEQAARWLESRGYQILERNFYCRQGEIDLVAEENGYLVFIEVKYRRDGHAGHPAEAVHPYKQKKIVQTAVYYCYKHQIPQTRPCRFDVVCILGDDVELIKNAFEML